jgi:murein DD-endopeptidase MepM/ murein hydrolase activator NlpD
MSSFRFAKGPLVLALVFGVLGAVVLLLPQFVANLPFAGVSSLAAAVLGALTLILLVVSFIVARRDDDDEDDDEITDEDHIPLVAFGPNSSFADVEEDEVVPLTRAQKKAAREDDKRERKAAAEREKFEKQSQKESQKAQKKAKKKGSAQEPDEDDGWIDSIRQPAEEAGFAGAFTPISAAPVFEETEPEPTFPDPIDEVVVAEVADDAADGVIVEDDVLSEDDTTGFLSPEMAATAVDEDFASAGAATDMPMYDAEPLDEATLPAWASAVYDDPTFVAPYTEDEAVTDEVAADEVAADEVAADEVAADEVAADEVAADEVVADEVAADEVAADEVAADEVAADEVAADEAVADEAVADEVAADEVAADEAVADEDAVVTDEVAADEVVTENVFAERADAEDEAIVADADDFVIHSDESDSAEGEGSVDVPADDDIAPDAGYDIITESDPEYPLEQLALQIEDLIVVAHREVRSIRETNRAEREQRVADAARLSSALAEARSEVGRLSDALDTETAERYSQLDAKAQLMQAEIATARARSDKEQAQARLRQVRLAILNREPVDSELLSIVEKSLSDLDGEQPAQETGWQHGENHSHE